MQIRNSESMIYRVGILHEIERFRRTKLNGFALDPTPGLKA